MHLSPTSKLGYLSFKGVDSTEFTSIPLHNAYLSPDIVSGHVVVGILPSLPFDGVHMLLGNDLAGSKVEVNPLVTDKGYLTIIRNPIGSKPH